MATDGTPEPAAKRCGEAIARLRTLRRWSRAQLVIRLYDELAPDDPSYNSISETWLARLENGRMVKVPRQTVEALCRALRCTPQERSTVLLYADRSVLARHDSDPDAIAEVLTYVLDRLYHEASDVFAAMIGERPSTTLDETELLQMTATALDLLAARKRKQNLQAANGQSNSRSTPLSPPLREGRLTLVPSSAKGANTTLKTRKSGSR
ncbi:MAG: helix-turn-helix domain-containing protein [Ktedonobacterales bacterium]